MKDLSAYSDNTYSQYGEDGIIEEILNRIESEFSLDNWCVEFGAWDGIYLSNTCRLIRERNFNAVLIEGDKKKVRELEINFPQENVHKICKFINFEGQNTLDNTLANTPIPNDFDFLSIDIDGVDYHILEGLKKYQPKIIAIEYNPTIPNSIEYIQKKDFNVKHGSSAAAILKLSQDKGYSLAAVTNCSLILVKNEFFDIVCEKKNTLEELRKEGNDITCIFAGYDGTILSNKDDIRLPWHGINVPIEKIQFLPNFLRIFRTDYGIFKKILLVLWVLYKMPSKIISFWKENNK